MTLPSTVFKSPPTGGFYRFRIVAGAVRVVLAVFALVVFKPMIALVRPVEIALYAYTIVASVFLVCIVLRLGNDRHRAIAGGCVDLAIITLLVHALGSTTSVFATIYIFASMLNTLVVGPRVGVTLSVAAALAYGGLLLAEQLGFAPIPHPRGTADLTRDPGVALASWLLTALLLVATTSIVAALVRGRERRELELREANARLLALTTRDPLTDLGNRRYLVEHLERGFALNEQGLFALAVIDLDGFKSVNDRFGHLAGDELLVKLARAISEAVLHDDIVCRFGGDEFVVMLRTSTLEGSIGRMNAIRKAIRSASDAFHPSCGVTASVGITLSARTDDAAELLRRADGLAYDAKRAGGDRVMTDLDVLSAAS